MPTKQASKKRADALTHSKNGSTVAGLSNTKKGDVMTTQQTSTASKPATSKPANGAPAAATEAKEQTQAAEESRRSKGGVIPTMPSAVVYFLNGIYHAAVFHPGDKSKYVETGKGIGSAKGALEDSGFVLSLLQADGPEWMSEFIPEGAVVQGYAAIKGFPLPKQ